VTSTEWLAHTESEQDSLITQSRSILQDLQDVTAKAHELMERLEMQAEQGRPPNA
jgi:hypothetical protein